MRIINLNPPHATALLHLHVINWSLGKQVTVNLVSIQSSSDIQAFRQEEGYQGQKMGRQASNNYKEIFKEIVTEKLS